MADTLNIAKEAEILVRELQMGQMRGEPAIMTLRGYKVNDRDIHAIYGDELPKIIAEVKKQLADIKTFKDARKALKSKVEPVLRAKYALMAAFRPILEAKVKLFIATAKRMKDAGETIDGKALNAKTSDPLAIAESAKLAVEAVTPFAAMLESVNVAKMQTFDKTLNQALTIEAIAAFMKVDANTLLPVAEIVERVDVVKNDNFAIALDAAIVTSDMEKHLGAAKNSLDIVARISKLFDVDQVKNLDKIFAPAPQMPTMQEKSGEEPPLQAAEKAAKEKAPKPEDPRLQSEALLSLPADFQAKVRSTMGRTDQWFVRYVLGEYRGDTEIQEQHLRLDEKGFYLWERSANMPDVDVTGADIEAFLAAATAIRLEIEDGFDRPFFIKNGQPKWRFTLFGARKVVPAEIPDEYRIEPASGMSDIDLRHSYFKNNAFRKWQNEARRRLLADVVVTQTRKKLGIATGPVRYESQAQAAPAQAAVQPPPAPVAAAVPVTIVAPPARATVAPAVQSPELAAALERIRALEAENAALKREHADANLALAHLRKWARVILGTFENNQFNERDFVDQLCFFGSSPVIPEAYRSDRAAIEPLVFGVILPELKASGLVS